MKRLYTSLSAIMMAAALALPSHAEKKPLFRPATQDTLIMKLKNNSKVLVVVKDLKDIKSLKGQSLDSMVLLLDKYADQINQAGQKAESNGGTVNISVSPSKDLNDPTAPEEVSITVTQSEDGGRNIVTRELKKKVRIDVDVDDSDTKTTVGINVNADSTKSEKSSSRYSNNSDSDFDFQVNLGLDNWLNYEALPGQNEVDLKNGSSRYISLNAVWDRRLGGERSPLHVLTGFGFDFHNYMFDDSYYLTSENGRSEFFQLPDISVEKSKLATTTFTVPLELGLDFKNENGKTNFKIGGGGFVGYLLNSHTKLKYSENGDNKKDKGKENYNLNDFQYGLSGFIGVRSLEFFVRYNLNELFENNKGPQANSIAFGVKLLDF